MPLLLRLYAPAPGEDSVEARFLNAEDAVVDDIVIPGRNEW